MLTRSSVLLFFFLAAIATGGAYASTPVGTCPTSVPSGVTKCYYVDFNAGSDSNNGLSEADPWQHMPGMRGCAGACAVNVPAGGSGYILKGGSVWPNNSLPWRFIYSGTSNAPIYIGYDSAWNHGVVNAILATSSGYNCTSIKVALSGGGGSGAAGTAVFQISGYLAGLLQHVTLTSPGSGYSSAPAVSFAGSSCTALPTAVADIQRPIIDAGGTIWNESNGAQQHYGPVLFSGNYLVVNGLEFRNALFDHTIVAGAGALYMVTQQNGTGDVYENLYLHNYGPDAVSESASASFNGTGGFSINEGEAGTVTVTQSYFDNSETEVTGANCGWSNNGTPNYYPPPCGSSLSVGGATTFTHNIVHDSRGQVYAPDENNLLFANNTIWDTTYDCCQQHADTLYFFGSGIIANNVIHDGAPTSAANIYVETCQGNPCTVGNVTYIFNNVVWNVGVSTPDIGFSSEFWGSAAVSPNPALYAWNNTLYAQNGTVDCINAGQWYGNSPNSTVNFYLYNNHCITDQSASHWFDAKGGNYGTWNGMANPNSAATEFVIDTANLPMTPAKASSEGYTISNQFSPTGGNGGTVTSAGTNFTLSTPGCHVAALSALCLSITSGKRPASGNWNMGAYQFNGTPQYPQPAYALGGGVKSN